MTSEAIFYGIDNPQPGGGEGLKEAPWCLARPDAGVFPARPECTLSEEHEGWHEAGIGDGLMIATWSDDE